MTKRSLLILFCTALGIRLIALVASGAVLDPEHHEYGRIARTLLTEGRLAWPSDRPYGPRYYYNLFEPAYPLLIAAAYRITGITGADTPAGPTTNLLILLPQIVASALSVVLVARLAARLTDHARIGWAAGIIAALNPLEVGYACRFFPLVFASTLYLAGLNLALTQKGVGSLLRLAAAGTLFGLAMLFAYPTVLVAVAVAAWFAIAQRSARGVLATCLAAAAVLTPYWIRSYRIHGEWAAVKVAGGFNAYIGNCPGASGTMTYAPGQFSGRLVDANRLSDLSELDLDRELARRALRMVLAEPGRVARLMLRKAAYFWFWPPAELRLQTRGAALRIADAALLLLRPLLILGLILTALAVRRTPRPRPPAALALFVPAAAWFMLFALHTLTVSGARRFVALAEPLTTLYVAVAVVAILTAVRRAANLHPAQ
jgi:4-amino-4-deoxy-L-arabinose transferase-like glycosyltransferase